MAVRKNNGAGEAVPLEVEREETGKILATDFADTTRLGTAEPVKLPNMTFLGMSLGSWTKLGLSYGLGAGLFMVAWFNTVNRELADRPTDDEVKADIDDGFIRHALQPHPGTDKRLKILEAEQRTIRESQIRSEQVDLQQTKTLEEIRDDVKRLRRNR